MTATLVAVARRSDPIDDIRRYIVDRVGHWCVLKLVVQNFAKQAEFTALRCDGRVERLHDVVLCDANSTYNYRNVAVPTRALNAIETDDLASRLPEFYGNRDVWSLDSFFPIDSTDDRLLFDGSESVMRFPSGMVQTASPGGLEIVEVDNERLLADFEQAWAFGMNRPQLLERDAKRYDTRILGGQRLWVGYVDGEPAATAGSFVDENLNLIRAVTVVPAHRKRGFGKAISLTAMAASELPRYLNSHPGAEALYQSIGFEVFSTFAYWSGSAELIIL